MARLLVFGLVWWSRWRKLCLLRDCNCRDQHLHIGNLCKGLVVNLSPLTKGSVYGPCKPGRHRRTRNVGKVYNPCRVKTNWLAVLTVKSGLDPHMINKLKDGYKSHSDYFSWPCWVSTISVLTLAYCCSEGKMFGSLLKMMLSSRRTQPPVDCLWSLESPFSG